jgi:hypothetical protein
MTATAGDMGIRRSVQSRSRLLTTNDGGLLVTEDGGRSWQDGGINGFVRAPAPWLSIRKSPGVSREFRCGGLSNRRTTASTGNVAASERANYTTGISVTRSIIRFTSRRWKT